MFANSIVRSLVCLSFIVLAMSSGSFAQDAIPGGTILPVQLNSSIRTDKTRPGQTITGRIMQDVPLGGRAKIPAGAKVIGHVLVVSAERSDASVSLRFDTLAIGKKRIPITTNLRALAGMMEVSEAQIPESGPDRGTSEYSWTTEQIGGEVAIHGSVVVRGSSVVGQSFADGVLVRAAAKPGTKCRGEVNGNDRPQALWVFSSDACGLYGFPDLTLAHAGRTSPVGEIVLAADNGKMNIRAGSGVLLRVNRASP